MAGWYNKVSDNLSNIIDCIDYYEAELAEAKKECYIKGNVERNSAALPGITEHRFNQLQEIDCLLYTSPSPRDGLLSRMPSSA